MSYRPWLFAILETTLQSFYIDSSGIIRKSRPRYRRMIFFRGWAISAAFTVCFKKKVIKSSSALLSSHPTICQLCVSSIRLSVYPSVCLSCRFSVWLYALVTWLSSRLTNRRSFCRPLFRSLFCPSFCLSPFVCLFVCQSVLLSILSSIYLYVFPSHCLCTSARPSFFYFLSFVIYFVRTSARLFVLLSPVRPSVCHLSYFSSSVRFPVFIFFPLSKYIPVRLSTCQPS